MLLIALMLDFLALLVMKALHELWLYVNSGICIYRRNSFMHKGIFRNMEEETVSKFIFVTFLAVAFSASAFTLYAIRVTLF